MIKVSQSKIKTWRSCKRKYAYRYWEKLRAKRKKRPLQFGSLIHSMIEADANGDDPFKVTADIRDDVSQAKMFSQEKEEYGDILNDVDVIMRGYFEYWEDRPLSYWRKGGKSAEHEFEVEIHPEIMLVGKIDAIANTYNELRALVEHKTFSRKPSDDERWRNLQSTSYSRVIDMLGWKPIEAVCWDYIWSKPVDRPALLQDGSMSVKKIDTLPHVVREFIEEHSLDHMFKYEEFMSAVEARCADRYDRVITPISKTTVDAAFDDLVVSAVEILQYEQDRPHMPMSIERHCSWCDYESLCRAKMQSHDYDHVKERQYAQEK